MPFRRFFITALMLCSGCDDPPEDAPSLAACATGRVGDEPPASDATGRPDDAP